MWFMDQFWSLFLGKLHVYTLANARMMSTQSLVEKTANLNKDGGSLWWQYMVVILNYCWLPLTTIHSIGKNRGFEA